MKSGGFSQELLPAFSAIGNSGSRQTLPGARTNSEVVRPKYGRSLEVMGNQHPREIVIPRYSQEYRVTELGLSSYLAHKKHLDSLEVFFMCAMGFLHDVS